MNGPSCAIALEFLNADSKNCNHGYIGIKYNAQHMPPPPPPNRRSSHALPRSLACVCPQALQEADAASHQMGWRMLDVPDLVDKVKLEQTPCCNNQVGLSLPPRYRHTI